MAYITEIYEWEGDETQPFGTFNWKTKLYNMDDRMRFGYGRIYFDEGDFDAYNVLINQNLGYLSGGYVMYVNAPHQGWPVGGLPLAGSVIRDTGSMPTYTGTKVLSFKVYVDEVLISTTQIYNQNPFRVNAQRRANRWEFELEGNVENVKRIEFAPSIEELKRVRQQGGS